MDKALNSKNIMGRNAQQHRLSGEGVNRFTLYLEQVRHCAKGVKQVGEDQFRNYVRLLTASNLPCSATLTRRLSLSFCQGLGMRSWICMGWWWLRVKKLSKPARCWKPRNLFGTISMQDMNAQGCPLVPKQRVMEVFYLHECYEAKT